MTDYTPTRQELIGAWIQAHSGPGWGGPVDIGGRPKERIAEGHRAVEEVERAAAENAVERFRTELCTALTAPDPDLSLVVGGQEYLATSIISTLLDEHGNPYRKEEH